MSGITDTQHGYYQREPIIRRPALRWPGEARLAFVIVVSAEHYDMQPPEGSFIPPNVPGGFGRGPYPDFRAYSARAYGNRVGIFRLIKLLDRFRLPATVAVDAQTAASCRALIEQIRSRRWEIAAHGQSVTRVISSRMSVDEEREYIRSAITAIEERCGVRPAGWHGPEYGESARTVELLAELGLRYVLDWPNDEQPYSMTSAAGEIVSLPMAIDLDDVFSHFHRKIPMSRWCRCLLESVDRLLRDGEEAGRVLVLNLHPWLIGHPFRISYLEDALGSLMEREGVWFATAGQIAESWRSQRIGTGLEAQP
jgi:peptidoglycan/xylan/chitin deacetylase (PgdA/CDA1 family)